MSNGQGVKTQHPEYIKNTSIWGVVRNAVAGTLISYLRNVGANEPDEEYGRRRQAEYEAGAICYNFTKRTLDGMIGSVMRKAPEWVFPKGLEYLFTNTDGSGVGLWQHIQDTLMEIDSIGRGGLLVDAPEACAHTMAEQNQGTLNPVIAFYTAENIINWRVQRCGTVARITLVVLKEVYEYPDNSNEFNTNYGEQYRVLDLVDDVYRQRIYRFDVKGTQVSNVEEFYPKVAGEHMKQIPFTFIGATNNDASVDAAPILPLAELNIGHFRNSADNEESSFTVGQPTLFIAPSESMGIEQFTLANPKGIRMGSRSGHNLGSGSNAWLVQAQENNLARENMLSKETQAIQIGAQLITPTAQITAESARIQRNADTSVMATIARNVGQAYEDALRWVAVMLNLDNSEIELKLNIEFFLQPMTAQDRAAWMADINAGLLPARAYFAALRKAGVTEWTDEEIETALEMQPIPSMAAATVTVGEIPPAAIEDDNE